MKRLLAIDPGTRVSGFATFEDGALVRAGLVRQSAHLAWVDRCRGAAAHFRRLPGKWFKVCEFPQFEASMRGTYASRQGDTLKLAFLCALLEADLYVTPSEWKGQRPKSVTQYRFKKQFNLDMRLKLDHNAVDAVMIGAWYLEEQGATARLSDKFRWADL